jgi:AcrR family transcriptional regulator
MPKPPRRKTPEPPPYHHGDLRAALIRSAGELLRHGGPEALTLRAVARHAGVSQAAPYRHFADLRALIGAVAEQGFQRLGAAMMAAMQQGDGRKGFKELAIAYVAFAHRHPAEYRIMFGPSLASDDDLPELRKTSREVLTFVQRGIEALQQARQIGPGNSAAMAAASWSMLHGLVMLSLDGQTDNLGLSLDELVQESTRVVMFGLAGGGAAPSVKGTER